MYGRNRGSQYGDSYFLFFSLAAAPMSANKTYHSHVQFTMLPLPCSSCFSDHLLPPSPMTEFPYSLEGCLDPFIPRCDHPLPPSPVTVLFRQAQDDAKQFSIVPLPVARAMLFYKLSNIGGRLQAYVFDVIRASIPRLNLDDTFEQKNNISKAAEGELEKAVSAYTDELV
ncbi:hypothetical protein OROMI_004947 [Orobanche minor]